MHYADTMENQATALKIKDLRTRANVSVREMARRVGMSPSGWGHYEDPRRFKGPYLPVDMAELIVAALERDGIDAAEVWDLTGAQSGEPATSAAPSSGRTNVIPIFNVEASAGSGSFIDTEYQVASLAFPEGYLQRITRANPRDLAVISVKGDSMTPTLQDDDVVMLDLTKRDLSYDGLFVIRDNGDALLVKRIGRASRSGHVSLISDNRDHYPSVERALTDIDVLGKVLWKGGKV